MNLFEYEGKQFLRRFEISVPKGVLLTGEDAPCPMDFPVVLKAQVMTGGRGKAGGIRVCGSEEEYLAAAPAILNMQIKGHRVHGLLAEQMLHAEREFYISITQQGVVRPTLIFSTAGGMEIEAVAEKLPHQIMKMEIDPFTHLKQYQKNQLAAMIGVEHEEAVRWIERLERAFFEGNALLVEINPLGVCSGKLIAMDAKVVIDDAAREAAPYLAALEEARHNLYRYIPPIRDSTTVTYVPLNGDVGLISDGAGTGMLALDLLTDLGLDVASFAELGGMITEEVIYRAMQLTFQGNADLKAVLIVLIGGFNRMDNMARGITRFVRDHNVKIPIFTRMCGTMEEEGIRMMQEAGLETFQDLTQTAKKLCAAVKGGRNGCRF